MKKLHPYVLLIISSVLLGILPAISYSAATEVSSDGSIISIKAENAKNESSIAIPYTASPGTFATITVDGNPSEWASIPVLISDPLGDSGGVDIVNIKLAHDSNLVYFLEEFSLFPIMFSILMLDTDLNSATGCQVGDWQGAEYGIAIDPDYPGFIGRIHVADGSCWFSSDDFPWALVYVVAGNFIEASFPISVLEVVSPGLTAFNIWSIIDTTVAARYNFASGNCLGLMCTLSGGTSPIIQGTNGDDVICGTDKDDIILGKSGHDTICGGAGNDIILADNGHDRVEGGPGDDILDGGAGMDMLDGGPDNDILLGGNDGDLLFGGMGLDYLSGGLGQDLLNGEPDNDTCEKESSSKLLVSCENAVSSTSMSALTLDNKLVSPALSNVLNILMPQMMGQ